MHALFFLLNTPRQNGPCTRYRKESYMSADHQGERSFCRFNCSVLNTNLSAISVQSGQYILGLQANKHLSLLRIQWKLSLVRYTHAFNFSEATRSLRRRELLIYYEDYIFHFEGDTDTPRLSTTKNPQITPGACLRGLPART
jgi:hypothetical protein